MGPSVVFLSLGGLAAAAKIGGFQSYQDDTMSSIPKAFRFSPLPISLVPEFSWVVIIPGN